MQTADDVRDSTPLAGVIAALEELEGTQAWGPGVERALCLARGALPGSDGASRGLAELDAPAESPPAYVEIYDAEGVLREVGRLNAELGRSGRRQLQWPGLLCEWTCYGRPVALLYGEAQTQGSPDALETLCEDHAEAAEEEFAVAAERGELSPVGRVDRRDLRRREPLRRAARELRQRIKGHLLVRQELPDPARYGASEERGWR